MADLFDYVNWRGDLSQSACRFSSVDYAIFSQIVMLDLSSVFHAFKDRLTVEEAFQKYSKTKNLDKNIGLIISNKLNTIFEEIAKAPRYKNLILTHYREVSDQTTSEQFSALTVELHKGVALVLFSGTDDSIHGWEENFSMIYEKVTKAQRRSLRYLESVASEYEKIYIAGHSKGGNLTAYCIKTAPNEVYDKIVKAIAFDAPGLIEAIDDEDRLKRFNKLLEYCPDNSLIGRLFNHYGKTRIVESACKGPLQHDLFSWEVVQNKFKRKDAFTENSFKVERRIHSIIKKLTKAERERFVRLTFEILYSTGANCLTDLYLKKSEIIKCYLKLSSDDRKFFRKIFLWQLVADKDVREMFLKDVSDPRAKALIANTKKYADTSKKAKNKLK